MDTKSAKQFFFEKKIYTVLRYLSYALLAFGIFSYIFVWSGVEIGTPFLVVGILLFIIVSSRTVKGKDYFEQTNKIILAESTGLEEQLANKESPNGSIITSKQFVINPSVPVKKANNTLLSPRAEIMALYCNDKTNRLHLLATKLDFLNDTRESIDIAGNLSEFALNTEELRYDKYGCMTKQVKAVLTSNKDTFELLLSDDYDTQKFIDNYFTNRRT